MSSGKKKKEDHDSLYLQEIAVSITMRYYF